MEVGEVFETLCVVRIVMVVFFGILILVMLGLVGGASIIKRF